MSLEQSATLFNRKMKQTQIEINSLETALKTAYNAYIDSLVDYLNKVNDINDERMNLINFQVEQWERNEFIHRVAPPLENQATKYLLDKDSTGRTTTSLVLVKACDINKLLERKA